MVYRQAWWDIAFGCPQRIEQYYHKLWLGVGDLEMKVRRCPMAHQSPSQQGESTLSLTSVRVFNVTYYLELHTAITFDCQQKVLLSKGFNVLQCPCNQFDPSLVKNYFLLRSYSKLEVHIVCDTNIMSGVVRSTSNQGSLSIHKHTPQVLSTCVHDKYSRNPSCSCMPWVRYITTFEEVKLVTIACVIVFLNYDERLATWDLSNHCICMSKRTKQISSSTINHCILA